MSDISGPTDGRVVVLLGVFLVAALAHGAEMPMECRQIINPDELDAGPLFETFDSWAAAFATADLDALTELVTADAEFWTHDRAPLTGRQDLRDALGVFLEDYVIAQDFECSELIVDRRWAFARGLEINRLTPKAGGPPVTIRQRAFSVLRRGEDGRWRFARGMTNSAPGDP